MTRRRRGKRPVPLREEVSQHLEGLLVGCLDDRVPLDRLGTVRRSDCKEIVTVFMAEHADRIERAIQAVEVFEPAAALTGVLELLIPDLVRYARQTGDDFLDKTLSPYAGQPRRR